MEKPLIGIIGRKLKTLDHLGDDGNIVTFDVINAIFKANGTPITLLTNELYQSIDTQLIDLCDALLFTGGYEVKPYHLEIMKYALHKRIPVLGICLGFQIMCMSSSQDRIITKIENTIINHHPHLQSCMEFKDIVHSVTLMEGSFLESLFSKNFSVNSRHRFTITKVENPLKVVGYSEDGLIEAIEHSDPDYFFVGVQWHPENIEEMSKLFTAFTLAAKRYQTSKKTDQ